MTHVFFLSFFFFWSFFFFFFEEDPEEKKSSSTRDLTGQNSWQQAEHARLNSGLLLAEQGEPLIALEPQETIFNFCIRGSPARGPFQPKPP